MPPAYRFEISGRVQGVGFRQATMGKALVLGLRGWVRNRDDGGVEGCVAGDDDDALAEFQRFLGHGPVAAVVDVLQWQPTAPFDDSGFRLLR